MFGGRILTPLSLVVPLVLAGLGCGEGDLSGESGDAGEAPAVYEFESRFSPGESSVSYAGQSLRQVLIKAVAAELDAINTEITVDGKVFAAGEVGARLRFYYQFDSETGGALAHSISTDPTTAQLSFDDISTDKNLEEKLAGNDPVGQHADWSSAFVGWDGSSPDATVNAWIDALDAMAVAYSSGAIPLDPSGAQIPLFYVSAEGQDLKQLLEKLLLGAVNFSQGVDDYLDDDTEAKGLLSDHTVAEEGQPYSALEHAWDEAFGYWGAARDYKDYSLGELAAGDGRPEYASGYHDLDGDGAIDLLSEYNFGAAVNAAKRDSGSADAATTDLSAQTMSAFLQGRHIIANAKGELSDTQLAELQEQRDLAVDGWDRALAATAVHYFNETLTDYAAAAADYSFVDHAKHWSELKGFTLSLQFNPRSPLSADDFASVHARIGTAPVLLGKEGADAQDVADYIAGLVEARGTLGTAYGFDAANLGDATGAMGW